MRINGIIWLRDVIDKLAFKHRVEQEEVEEVFDNRPKFRFLEKGERAGEDVYVALGQSNVGRYLAVMFIHKKKQGRFDFERTDHGTEGKKVIWQKVNPGRASPLAQLVASSTGSITTTPVIA